MDSKPKQREQNSAPDYPTAPTLILWLFLGFVLFRYLQGGYRFPVLGAIRFEAIIGAILVGAAILMQLRHKPPQPKLSAPSPKLAGWVSAFVLVMFIQTVSSYYFVISWEVFVERVVKFGLFSFMIFSFVTSPKALRYFIAAYLLSFMRMTYEGIAGYLNGSMVWQNQGVPRLHGSTPSYHHPNSLGGTQLSTLAFSVPLWPISPLLIKAVLCTAGVGAVAVSIFTGSRTAYVALGVWLAYMIYRSRSRFRTLAVLAAIMAVAAPLIPDAYYARFDTIFTGKEIEGGSMDARGEILSDAIAIFSAHPLGIGVGAFPAVRHDYFKRDQDTHNLYLEIATNLGVPGFIVFIGLIIALFRSLRYVEKQSNFILEKLSPAENNPDTKLSLDQRSQIKDLLLIRQVAVALTGFIIVRLSLGLFGHDLYEIYWWFMIGLTGALVKMVTIAELKADFISLQQERDNLHSSNRFNPQHHTKKPSGVSPEG
ncbi:MAG: O-antigen ligase family protein [Chromatiales bacterium]|nr:O-antigen ligase family protein [Chromatiales bacterium]